MLFSLFESLVPLNALNIFKIIIILAIITAISYVVYKTNWRGMQIFLFFLAIVLYITAEIMYKSGSWVIVFGFLFGVAGIVFIIGILAGWFIKYMSRRTHKK